MRASVGERVGAVSEAAGRARKSVGGVVHASLGETVPLPAPKPKAAFHDDADAHHHHRYCASKACGRTLNYLAHLNLSALLFAMFLVFAAPTFYDRVFLPCWDCYDFEATMAHEIGHALGFNHPDSLPNLNLRAVTPMGPATCTNPLAYVSLSPPEMSDSLMFSITRHRSRTCLTADDVEGLDFLYPSCTPGLAAPKCIKTRSHSGYLRLAVAIGVPYLLTTIAILALMSAVRSLQKRRLASLEEEVVRQRVKAAWKRGVDAVSKKMIKRGVSMHLRSVVGISTLCAAFAATREEGDRPISGQSADSYAGRGDNKLRSGQRKPQRSNPQRPGEMKKRTVRNLLGFASVKNFGPAADAAWDDGDGGGNWCARPGEGAVVEL